MQPKQPAPTDLKPQKSRRRRRPRTKKTRDSEPAQPTHIPKDRTLGLHDLASEASALEKQLYELQAQLKSQYAAAEDAKRSGKAAIIGQTSATEDETKYIRDSLEKIYKQILLTDPLYGTQQRFEDRLWRNIFYARIEYFRSKLRQPEGPVKQRQRLSRDLVRHIDTGVTFYSELNSMIKTTHHIDTRTIGIDLLRQLSGAPADEQVAVLLQSNYICMGDLARYRATQLSSGTDKIKTRESWSAAKSYYQKAIDVYRSSGKPYCQMALVSLSSGSAIDVVWCYSMSIAMKVPSSVGRENMRAFYAKVRFSRSKEEENVTHGNDAQHAIKLVSQFTESFLQVHMAAMHSQHESVMPTLQTSLLELAVTSVILAAMDIRGERLPKPLAQVLHVLKSTLTRTITVLLIAVWDLGERAKEKTNLADRSQCQSSQINLLICGFQLMSSTHKTAMTTLKSVKNKRGENDSVYSQLEMMVDNAILPALSIWCTYLLNNIFVCEQYCAGMGSGNSRLVGQDTHKKELVKAMQAFLSLIISHPSFPDPVLHALPTTFPMTEDLVLLGLVPLAHFHSTVDYFKESTYQNDASLGARKLVRWSRIRDLFKKMADSTSIEFVHYNQTEQKYSITDEHSRRQQQNRFMKALAAQRLMDQVSSLEKNVNKMTLSPDRAAEGAENPSIYTVVVDVTAFLDGLNKVKKWASRTMNPNRRQQTCILEVVVPLEVIDELDCHKKGSKHMNMQARESIRYLDQTLLENGKHDKKTDAPTSSFLRTQKLDEQLGAWEDTEAFWLGHERPKDNLLASDDPDDDRLSTNSGSDEDLFRPRRRRTETDDVDEDNGADHDSDSLTEEEDSADQYAESEDDSENDSEDDKEEWMEPTWKDVPKECRSIIRCMLYYKQHRERVVLVTNDDNIAWWAGMFGDPQSQQALNVKTVPEWDKELVGNAWTDR